ncbi:DEAD/DEAH box helicase [Undibacterium piscinae]|uniref:DEAD/DEAH box helicase n=1 Tax=Undibacterium piscinae TaxID=2495591 RepID=A0A6M4A155_9BURK|nr:DEAD/DEAH box helicase [Undibacterium piscinae]
MPFTPLGLCPALANAALEHAYSSPSEIQRAAIPAILDGRDVLASAQTGSGKTAAFCLPLLDFLQTRPRTTPRQVQALILVPTRELAVQVGETLRTLSEHLAHPVKLAVLFGGISINPQMLHLRGGADVVVATPGRLLDLLDKNALQLSHVRSLVLDEADRLLELGFADELSQILALLPAHRQSLFFSATMPPQVELLANAILHEPLRIDIASSTIGAPDILQRAIVVDAKMRTQLLRHLIEEQKWTRVLVFVATKYAAELVAAKLRRVHINAEPFHGELSQGKRSQVLMDFKASRVKVVIATDVAARGIDISNLPVVVNYDLPRSSDDYTHRIGRTARAGESGIALSFICSDAANQAHFRLIEQRHQQKITREHIAGFEPSETTVEESNSTPPAADPNGGIKGKRPSKKDKLRALAKQGAPQDTQS